MKLGGERDDSVEEGVLRSEVVEKGEKMVSGSGERGVELRRREESGEVGIGESEKGKCKGYLSVSPTMRNLLSLLYLRGGVISGTHFSWVQFREGNSNLLLFYLTTTSGIQIG